METINGDTAIIAFGIAVAILLFLILKLRIQAFLALLICSIIAGLIAGMPLEQLLKTVQTGMGSTLGFVAVVVGLGALFGAILEHAGGAHVIASFLMKKFGPNQTSLAMVITGFIIAIPVFFDVAFIILVPVVYALKRTSKKSLLHYALPLLAGLAITHAFVPPTPGPVAVAEILGADLGWVIIVGFCAGIPAAIVGGIFFSRFIANRIKVGVPDYVEADNEIPQNLPSIGITFSLIFFPLLLIVIASITELYIDEKSVFPVAEVIIFLGHPFTALILANLLAWYLLGIRRNVPKETLQKVSEKSLMPAGIIILLTGAGGVLKQVLMDTGAGVTLAAYIQDYNIPVLIFAFLTAGIIRILQGSATVAMITSAGLTAPLLPASMHSLEVALIVIAISSGATIVSHVNDSGFWLVNRFLGLSVKQTLQSWTVLSTVIGITGFITVLLISAFL